MAAKPQVSGKVCPAADIFFLLGRDIHASRTTMTTERSPHRDDEARPARDGHSLVQALRNPCCYPHPAGPVEVIETHASWVLLTGVYAYKIKKPVNLGFLDFSTLAKRKHSCEEELRINRRLAADLYLEVVPIGGSADHPRLGEGAPAIEYALKMRQFDQSGLLDRLASSHRLTTALIRECAQTIAEFHARAARLPVDSPLASAAAVAQAMLDNFSLANLMPGDAAAAMAALAQWTHRELERLTPSLTQRRADGFVRECHGDLHLANITLHEGRVVPFDGIDFNDEFRWIDIISDLAFLLMDLEFRNEGALANLALNTWLEFSGDFDGLALLPLYKTYRAMVRAKVALLTATNASLTTEQRHQQLAHFHAYLALAQRDSQTARPMLLCTCGLSASGKSHVSAHLAAQFGLVRLRSDVERKRLFGLAPLAASHPDDHARLYSADAGAQTYQRLATLTRQLLAQGQAVIVDAAFLREAERAPFMALARELALPFAIIHCEAPLAQRRHWLAERRNDPSEATEALLTRQADWFEPFSAAELSQQIHVATDTPGALTALTARVREHIGVHPATATAAPSAAP